MTDARQKKSIYPTGKPLEAQTFASALGQAVWLMTMDKAYRDLPIHEIEARVATPIFLQQFKVYQKGKQPVAFLTWAMVSDEVKERVETGEKRLELKDWRSGTNQVVVECVSPFGATNDIEDKFWASLKSNLSLE